MIKRMTGSQAAIAQLVAEGVTHILGIPGDHNIAICDAVLDFPQLSFLTGRHEHGLVCMANGYSRATHRIAVPLVVSGPGVTNALTALGDAYQDSVPMVMIAARPATTEHSAAAFHALRDQSAAIASVAKWSTSVNSPEEIPEAIRTAFAEAYQGRPGPTVVEIPLDIQTAEGDMDIYPSVHTPPSEADEQIIDQAVHALIQAKNPIICAGRGGTISGAAQQLQQLVESLQAPCFLTAQGKGLLHAEHPLNISWGLGRNDFISQITAQSDVAFVIGSSLDYADAGRLNLQFSGTLIQLDTCAETLGAVYPADIRLHGDAKYILEKILSRLAQHTNSSELANRLPSIVEPKTEKNITFSAYKEEKLQTLINTPVWQYMQAIQHGITDDTLIFGDPARCNGWGVAFLERNHPNTYHCSRNFCTLGFSVSAAMGAKLAYPERQVLAMIGDGGLLFANGDLATVAQYEINIVTILFNDESYGSIRRAQQNRFGRTIGVDLHNPDFCQLADSFGIAAVKVHTPEQLTKALLHAWETQKPWVIEIPIKPDDPEFNV